MKLKIKLIHVQLTKVRSQYAMMLVFEMPGFSFTPRIKI